MKAHLLFADADLDTGAELPPQAGDLITDLGLDVLATAMAGRDKKVRTIATTLLLHPLTDPDAVVYRQQVLADCLATPDIPTGLHQLARDTIEGERGIVGWFSGLHPEPLLRRSISVLNLLLDRLRELRAFAAEHTDDVTSPGFRTLFAMLATELDDAYLAEVARRIHQLRMANGMLISARLGSQNESVELTLRDLPERGRGLTRRPVVKRPSYSYTISDRDDASTQALAEMRDRVSDSVANAAAQSAQHVLSFFAALRDELEFYLAAMRLHTALTELGIPLCMPQALPAAPATHAATGLVDPVLALTARSAPTGNDLDATGKQLVVITGANRGGKSTYLRAIGTAALMAGAGLYVAADRFTTSLHSAVFTHFRREEDAQLRSGKLDEELHRMHTIAAAIRPSGLLLCNESFAATNEAEGSELARQVVTAFSDLGVTVCYVTHQYEFAHGVAVTGHPPAAFLRAEPGTAGQHPFTLVPGEPLPTSYGADVYQRVFGTDPVTLPAGRTADSAHHSGDASR